MQDATAFVLAGGQSSRMGSNKALLCFGPQSLLERSLELARQVCSNVNIVGQRELYATFGNVVEDIRPGCGPLGGIHAALSASPTDLNLIISVDMPLMNAQFLTWLLAESADSQQDAIVPEALGRIQPLCAVYRRSFAEAAERALLAGDYKIGVVLQRTATRYVTEGEITSAGFDPMIFRNVNTPEEFEAALRETGMSARNKEIVA